jgi:PAS domain S-box-containing protein
MFRIFGMEPGAIHPTHDSFFGMVHEDDRKSIATMMADTIESGQTYETEFRIIRVDGATRHVFERGERFIDEQTGEWSVHGIMQDITERKTFEDELRETAANLENSQRIARLGSWIWDAKEDKEWWSDEIYRMFGMEVGSVVVDGYGYLDYVHPDDRERVRAIDDESLSEGKPYSAEYRVQRVDGREIVVSDLGEIEYDEMGRLLRMRGTMQDITERKAVEDKLRETAENLEKSERIAKLGSWTWEIEEDKEWWSDEVHRIVGWELEPAYIGGRVFLDNVHPDDRERVNTALDKSFSEQVPYIAEYRFRHADGHEIIISEHAEIEYDEAGKPLRMRGTTHDVTEYKRIEQQLARLNAELEQRVEERTAELRTAQGELVKSERLATLGQLTATVSHELRNPLGAMRTSMYVVEKKTDADDQRLRAAIDRVNRNITRCDQIIDELLDYTRIRDLNIQQTNINNWLGAVLSEQTVPDGVEVTRKFRAGGARVPADSDRLRRAVINIFENACQAVTDARRNETLPQAPEVTVETRLKNDRLEILITDNGPGVPVEIREKIFEPLFSTKNFGVGLGLPTVRQIMKQHGGGVTIGEKRGGGAKFALWLPLAGELEIANK